MTDGLTMDNKVSSKTVELYSFSYITVKQFNQKTEMCHYDSSIKESRGFLLLTTPAFRTPPEAANDMNEPPKCRMSK